MYEHGALIVQESGHLVKSVLDELKLPLIPELAHTAPENISNHSNCNVFRITYQYLKYLFYAYYYREFETIHHNHNDPKNVPGESIQDFLDRKNLTELTPIFEMLILASGYGELSDAPMHHMISVLGWRQVL
eukprot:UN27358